LADSEEKTEEQKKKEEKEALIAEKAEQKRLKREERARLKAHRRAARKQYWNNTQSEDAQLIFIVNGILWFLGLSYLAFVTFFFITY